jgi:hypothetical protein
MAFTSLINSDPVVDVFDMLFFALAKLDKFMQIDVISLLAYLSEKSTFAS